MEPDEEARAQDSERVHPAGETLSKRPARRPARRAGTAGATGAGLSATKGHSLSLDAGRSRPLTRCGAADAFTGSLSPRLRPARDHETRESFGSMVGASPVMRDLFRLTARAALLDCPVLIQGESGTGKELVARSIHARSKRRSGPFVAVNCAACPTPLFEAQFFGHERGAYTDAHAAGAGWFEAAGDGTIFLDEVGDLPREVQAKLLRAVEGYGFVRLGGHKLLSLRARVLAATHVDLDAARRRGEFREDLYWRLAAVVIPVPPVRERGADLALLLDHALDVVRRTTENDGIRLTRAARRILLAHDWPGNVREIEHTLLAAGVAAVGGVILPGDLPPSVTSPAGRLTPVNLSMPPALTLPEAIAAAVGELERTWIAQALAEAGGNRTKAARRLDIAPRTLYTKLHGRQVPDGATGDPLPRRHRVVRPPRPRKMMG